MTKEELAGIRSSIMDAIALFESIWRGLDANWRSLDAPKKGNGSPPAVRPRVSALSIVAQLKAAADKLSQQTDKEVLLETRAAILDALAYLEPLRRGPDGEGGNGGMERRRAEQTALRVTWRLRAAAERLEP